MNEAPHLMSLLTKSKGLISEFSICANLTTDLFNAEYQVVDKESSSSDNEVEEMSLSSSDDSSLRTPKRARQSVGARTLKDLGHVSEVSDTEVQEGFLDEKSGEKVYLISKVIKYEPRHGYFVHWQGFPKSERSWQAPGDMPAGFAKEMAHARQRYREQTGKK